MITNRVSTYRALGLNARWTKVNGAPFIQVQNPQCPKSGRGWWLVDRNLFNHMNQKGIVEALEYAASKGGRSYAS